MVVLKLVSLSFIWFIRSVGCETARIAFTPDLAPAIKGSSEGFRMFISIWEFSIKMENRLAQTRALMVPKTLLIPGDFAMAHLVPQDAFHPLFLPDQKYEPLRREFILDHLILESIHPDDIPAGINTGTLSGKPIVIKEDTNGQISANGISVHKMFSLNDGPDTYRIFVLKTPLFDQAKKVRRAFEEYYHIDSDEPTGPPLEIPDGKFETDPSPPPPPNEERHFPNPSPPNEEREFPDPSPQAPPNEERHFPNLSPPAPPPTDAKTSTKSSTLAPN